MPAPNTGGLPRRKTMRNRKRMPRSAVEISHHRRHRSTTRTTSVSPAAAVVVAAVAAVIPPLTPCMMTATRTTTKISFLMKSRPTVSSKRHRLPWRTRYPPSPRCRRRRGCCMVYTAHPARLRVTYTTVWGSCRMALSKSSVTRDREPFSQINFIAYLFASSLMYRQEHGSIWRELAYSAWQPPDASL